MNIYFAASIRGGRDDKELYMQLIQHLQKYGQVLTEHVGSPSLTHLGDNASEQWIYQRDMSWIQESDIVIAEVSTPSLGVGYEIRTAEELGKEILCLYRIRQDRSLSAMLSGNPRLNIARYRTLEDAVQCIDTFFMQLEQS